MLQPLFRNHASRRTTAVKRREDAQRLREHFRTWLGRRLRGTSSGDNITAKRQELIPFETGDI